MRRDEVAATVAEDLAFLRRQKFEHVDRAEIRIFSGMLRRLLHEGLLLAAWKAVGLNGEPEIEAIDLDSMVEGIPRHFIHFAYAGGARLEGAHHRGLVFPVIPRAEVARLGGVQQALESIGRRGFAGRRRAFSLQEFCESACVVAGEAQVSRLELVRYVANKLGGVHLDRARGEWEEPLGSKQRFLDEDHLLVGRFPAPFFELLSITKDVATAEGTATLIASAAEKFPGPDLDDKVLYVREGRLGKYAEFRFEKRATTGEGEG